VRQDGPGDSPGELPSTGPEDAPPGAPGSWEIVERAQVHRGFFSLDVLKLRHRLFGGGWSPVLRRELFRTRRAAVLLPYDPLRDVVVLIEQFRVGALEMCEQPWMLEACAGLAEADEPAEAIARRECLEECGLEPRRLAWCCEYAASPGSMNERVTVYVGEVTAPERGDVHGIAAEGEDIRTHVLPLAEALSLLQRGRIVAVTAVTSLLWLQVHKDRLRAEWART
jgi:ADP-ribose pyrophosphatase